MRFYRPSFHAFFVALVWSGISAAMPALAKEPVALTHIHGLSFSADGARLMIPSHHGLAIFENGRWAMGAGPAHDYMGFSATRDALYSSGHPAPGSNMTNPFGLIKSRDGGKSWQKLGLEGESDFHTLATSYGTNAVYVVNHSRNSRMRDAGIYHTRNDGLKWSHAAAKGLGGDINSLAVHPTDADVVAVGTTDGLFLSRDSAKRFERLVSGQRIFAGAFDLDGQHLWFGTYAGKAGLARIALKGSAKAEELPIPEMMEDAVAYIAQNPVRHSEIVIATFKRNLFLSKDQGLSWVQIAKNGATLE